MRECLCVPSRRSPFSPARTPRTPRRAPFPSEHRLTMDPSKPVRLPLLWKWMAAFSRLAMDGPVVVVGQAMARRNVQRSIQMVVQARLFSPRTRWIVHACDLRGAQCAVTAIARSHPPNPGAPRRAFSQGRWRDAMFEDPFGRSPGWIKFAESSGDTALRFAPRLSSEAYPPRPPSLRTQAAAGPCGFTSRWSSGHTSSRAGYSASTGIDQAGGLSARRKDIPHTYRGGNFSNILAAPF
jgi:hypothetical protein